MRALRDAKLARLRADYAVLLMQAWTAHRLLRERLALERFPVPEQVELHARLERDWNEAVSNSNAAILRVGLEIEASEMLRLHEETRRLCEKYTLLGRTGSAIPLEVLEEDTRILHGLASEMDGIALRSVAAIEQAI